MKNEEYSFKTLVKRNHKFGESSYVLGRISAFKMLLCDGLCDGIDKPGHAMFENENGHVLFTECAPEKYAAFTNLVEKHYPDLCVFNYDVTNE